MQKGKQLSICVPPKEHERLLKEAANTTCRSLAEYCRKIVLGQPIVVTYRDRSFDDFTEACIQLKKDLDTIILKGIYSEREKQWANKEIELIKEKCLQIYNYVRESKNNQKPF
jgi:hypothetical protein